MKFDLSLCNDRGGRAESGEQVLEEYDECVAVVQLIQLSDMSCTGRVRPVLRSGNPISSLTDNRRQMHSLIHTDQHERQLVWRTQLDVCGLWIDSEQTRIHNRSNVDRC